MVPLNSLFTQHKTAVYGRYRIKDIEQKVIADWRVKLDEDFKYVHSASPLLGLRFGGERVYIQK